MRRAAVVGVGQTKHARARKDVNMAGLVREAAQRALADAGLVWKDIDAVVLGTAPDFFEGVMLPEQWLAGAVGAYLKPILRIHTAGSVGGATAVSAFYHVASGAFDTVLAIGFEKHSESNALWGLSPKSAFGRSFGAGAGAHFAPFCRAYMELHRVPTEIGPRIAVTARENGCLNPYAHLQSRVTLAAVLESPMLWDPIRRLESCPSSDGAAAMVLAAEERAPKLARRPVWVKAAAAMAEGARQGGHLKVPAAVECARKAYSQAAISRPMQELRMAEIYVPFSWIEVILYEALGLCSEGEGWRLIDRGVTALSGAFPVNPSGGVLCTNPIGASGMLRMVEAALQVMGKAEGGHQVDGVSAALGHAYGGSLNYHAMMIFSDRP